eukprot:1615091-Prymnesium_polylepis.1
MEGEQGAAAPRVHKSSAIHDSPTRFSRQAAGSTIRQMCANRTEGRGPDQCWGAHRSTDER